MDTNMKAELVKKTMINACKSHPGFRGAVCHSDRGTQYTSQTYRDTIKKYKMQQSMNSAGGRCHDNARCEEKRRCRNHQ
jgi:transposase InsO family protein